ncbi:hypothetical protein LEP1GSC116_2070 [Leptospira interrogans serovar Icterohaemorrhagiae str. Verdun HP]|uniref:PX domain-containing protein n=2 Tax=Leptospira interrogans TaxID=173 RepID=M6S0B1_LEPIR|nr:hypothetical protein LEP1GSC150_4032 [Leptospira interrogans serovar Copenhageni str. LT2050]EMO06443.1 hypothetical protein LEP1GSC116_2070 [Leptospira interrogans serovar Icterohaemorrhagiae str. Verdun HP]
MRRFQNFFSVHNSIFLIFLFSGLVLLAGPEKKKLRILNQFLNLRLKLLK